MQILQLKDQDISKYNKLSLSHGSIFNTIEWTNLFENGLKRYGIYNNGNELIGGFITYMENKFGLNVYRNPQLTPEIGIFLKTDASNPVRVMDMWKKAISLIADVMDELPYSIISYSFNKNVIDMHPFIWKRFKVIPAYTYILDLSLSIEEIWKRMSGERRKNIKKGNKDRLVTKYIEDLEIVKQLVHKTYYRQNKTIDISLYNKVFLDFANSENSFAYCTYHEERPIACTFCIYDKHTAYYILGGYDSENKHHGGSSLAMWESINHAKKIGLNWFDFEGSMLPQIERYFRGFGGTLTPYYRINKAKLPLEILLKFYKRDLF